MPKNTGIENETSQIQFQTRRDLTVSPARLMTVLAGSEVALSDCSKANETAGKSFSPFGVDPQPGHALYLGFDNSLLKTQALVSLYVWVNSAENDIDLKRRLREECKAENATLKNCKRQMLYQRMNWLQHYSVRTKWEYYDGAGAWLPLARVVDETRGLTLSGAVRFMAPDNIKNINGEFKGFPNLYFIRCRLESGHFDCPPQLCHIALNAVPAHNAIRAHRAIPEAEEKLGESNGRAGQLFQLQFAPVVPGSTGVTIPIDSKIEEWHEALNWDRVGPHDQAYVLSPETGQITFGNGLHGRVPKAGTTILAHYRSGGGAEAEPLVNAMGRAMIWLTDTHRAITLTDFEQIALKRPGVPVAKAYALADYHPALPGLPALGSITVVVLPQCADPIPEPGPDMLRAIKQYLDRRRMLTSEIYVISPQFITVAVQARLHASPDADVRQLITQARASLDSFFHPLHGGQDGSGWPMGRDVYRAEIMARLNAIPGISYVDEVTIKVEGELATFAGNVLFKRIIRLGEATIFVRGRLLIAPTELANQVVGQACKELERYIRTQRGWLKFKQPEVKRAEALAVLNGIPGIQRVDEICLNDQSDSGGLCENLTVCPTSLLISGQHQITVVPA